MNGEKAWIGGASPFLGRAAIVLGFRRKGLGFRASGYMGGVWGFGTSTVETPMEKDTEHETETGMKPGKFQFEGECSLMQQLLSWSHATLVTAVTTIGAGTVAAAT